MLTICKSKWTIVSTPGARSGIDDFRLSFYVVKVWSLKPWYVKVWPFSNNCIWNSPGETIEHNGSFPPVYIIKARVGNYTYSTDSEPQFANFLNKSFHSSH